MCFQYKTDAGNLSCPIPEAGRTDLSQYHPPLIVGSKSHNIDVVEDPRLIESSTLYIVTTIHESSEKRHDLAEEVEPVGFNSAPLQTSLFHPPSLLP